MVDRNGHALTVGMVVKVEATIVSIDESNTHYAGVVLKPSYPTYVNPTPNAIGVGTPNVNQDNTGPAVPNPQNQARYAFDGTQLTYVSG